MHNIVNVVNITELCTLKWLILSYVNFTSIKKRKNEIGGKDLYCTTVRGYENIRLRFVIGYSHILLGFVI